MSTESSWGMGFELFARLVAEKYAGRGGDIDDASIKEAAACARRAVKLWHATKPVDAPPTSGEGAPR